MVIWAVGEISHAVRQVLDPLAHIPAQVYRLDQDIEQTDKWPEDHHESLH
jgi:hypothetical protein